MGVLLIDDTVRQDLKDLAEYAYKNEYSIDDMLDRKNGDMDPPGDDVNFFRRLNVGYKVVFTVENTSTFKARHMSISTMSEGKLPSHYVVNEILGMLGFEHKIILPIDHGNQDFYVSMYERNCINVIERIKNE